MSGGRCFAVITTIQAPSPAVRALHVRLSEVGGRLIVAGDVKGPATWELPDSDFLSLADQQSSGFALAESLPVGHYARKNIGYLHAMSLGAALIYETDDDNTPLPRWNIRNEHLKAPREVDASDNRWINVYRYFSEEERVWPRGFPLDAITEPIPTATVSAHSRHAPIQQGLVNGSPDVDAIWRLVDDHAFEFNDGDPVWLGQGQWCPFNTQSTWWWPVAYPLLYVPSHCSFRMCDIWKSFVAQRCLWTFGAGVAFHAPEVVQDRNAHDLMKDFEDEVPGYLQNRRIAELLSAVALDPRPDCMADVLRACYAALIDASIFPAKEMTLVNAWLADVEAIGRTKHA